MTTLELERPANLVEAIPATLSGWLAAALDDLEVIERDSRYKIDMSTWHHGEAGKPCEVCMAGALMARRLGFAPTQKVLALSLHVDDAMRCRLQAIDHARMGSVDAAYRDFYGVDAPGPIAALDQIVTPYDADRAEFKEQMRELIEDLRRHGI